MASREQMLAQAKQKQEFLRGVLREHPGMSSAGLLGMVQDKFGSSVAAKTLAVVRAEVRREAKGAPSPVDDERREVELVAELQALMRRRNYQAILIPVEGTANIRLTVELAKTPGQHVEADSVVH
jgi:hypothetical protein